ncbi:MAG: 16S rRNA (adenine(1518)-N(6)/adenine(1519)-N(6))-dimethyltransferase RsmA [Candidatus Nitrospinota bacterium M3_3B_026]
MPRGRSGRKKLGQCFLIDAAVAERIVAESGVRAGERVLEVGPGRGILTRALLRAGAIVHAVELDEALFERLEAGMAGTEGLTLERVNALFFDYSSIEPPYHVIANLPYSVSVPLIKKFIENKDKISSMTLMVQAEVGGRLTARAGDSAYGSLSIYIACHAAARYLFTVPPSVFRPRPKVHSAVVRIDPLEKPLVSARDEDEFFRFIAAAFTHRRKMLWNNLIRVRPDRDSLEAGFAEAGVPLKARPQDVSLEEYSRLFRRVWRR